MRTVRRSRQDSRYRGCARDFGGHGGRLGNRLGEQYDRFVRTYVRARETAMAGSLSSFVVLRRSLLALLLAAAVSETRST